MYFSSLVACALVAASSVSAAASNSTDKPRVLIKPCFFNKIQRYTKFAAASYLATLGSGRCDYPPFGSTIIARININATDTQAAVFRDDDREEIIVTFPGTTGQNDYDTDFDFKLVPYVSKGVDCGACLAHQGFLRAWNSILPAVQTVLDDALEEYPCYGVSITGHSLGGALAALAFPSLTGLKYPVKFTYTYGQPRVGDRATANYIDKLSGASNTSYGTFRRVTHSYDGVPNLPPVNSNYSHPMTEFFELDNYLSNGTQVPLALDNDALSKSITQAANSTYRCFGHDAIDCNTGAAKGFINQAHLMYSGIKLVGGDACQPPKNTTATTITA